MYTVYLDDELLYHQNMEALSIESTKLSMEVNKTGSFHFTIREGNSRYNQLQKLKSIIRIYDGTDRIFRGRVLNSVKGFYNDLQITCEGELAFLLDSKLRPYEFEGTVEDYFTYLITEHNRQVGADRQFKIGRCTVKDPNGYITRSDSNYPDTFNTIQEKLIKKLGGYIWTREEPDGVYIDYLARFEETNTQEVVFGENLLDFVETIKGKDIYTAIIPLGAKITNEAGEETGERLTIADINNGLDYVYSAEAVEKYGFIYKVIVWDDVTIPANLLSKGTMELQNHINLLRSIELTAVDLHALNLNIQGFRIGKYTKVKSEPHNLDESILTRKIEINILDPTEGMMSLGDETFTFVDKHTENKKTVEEVTGRVDAAENDIKKNQAEIEEAKEQIKQEKTARELAIENLANRLSTSSGLFMTKEQQEDGSYIYYMHDKTNLSDSMIIWKLTASAFGISTDGGVSYPYGFDVSGTAILNKIYTIGLNADHITTGALTAKDESGNVVFSFNVATGEFFMKASSVTTGEQTVEDAINTAQATADANAASIAVLEINTENINASVSKIETTTQESLDGMNQEIKTLTQKVETSITSEDVEVLISRERENGANKVVTQTGFKFDEEGLTVSKSDSEMETTITEDGMEVSKNGETVLVANSQGVDATNLHAKTYLIIGDNSRFEDYELDGVQYTGCFWIGE